jgi:hypothetical protein
MLRVSTKARHRNAPRIADKSAPQFLQWLRGRPCILALNGECEGKIEAAHIDFAGGKGIRSKVADRFAIPMCAKHHRQQHSQGWQTFMASINASRLTILEAASEYWRAWPGRAAWERKLSDG